MTDIKKGIAGKRGDKVRSDCYIEISEKTSGGIDISLRSKVEALFGKSIKESIMDMCEFFGLKNADILVEDSGALPYTLAARFELAVKRLYPDIKKEYLPEMQKTGMYESAKERTRRSRLYLPGNEPKFYPNAGLHEPDGIILDLEDSVAHTEKDAARLLVRNALRAIDFYGAERMVRINQLPEGLDDLDYVIPHNVNVILIPKVENAGDVQRVAEKIYQIRQNSDIKNETWLMPIIESARGVMNAVEIAEASSLNCALTIGLEDYTADIGTQRTEEGTESLFARNAMVNAAKAARIQAIDSVYSDVSNMEGLRDSVIEAKKLGFEGKGCIHPRQVKVIKEAFAPEAPEIEKAKKIVLAFEEAEAKGIGVVSLGSKMIDAPVVKRARKTVDQAVDLKLIPANWREEETEKEQ